MYFDRAPNAKFATAPFFLAVFQQNKQKHNYLEISKIYMIFRPYLRWPEPEPLVGECVEGTCWKRLFI